MKKTTEARVSGTLDPLVVRLSNSVTIIHGDCREVLKTLADASVNCCVTSPPYFNLRDYGHAGQIGLEQTPDEYVAALVEVFREVRRVLRDDGTLWLNLGDSYAGSGKGRNADGSHQEGGKQGTSRGTIEGKLVKTHAPDCKPKDLIGIPWRVAFALQADGWYLRQDIIWAKGTSGARREGNIMPESVKDRCSKAHEYIFLLTKSPRYYFDNEAIKEPAQDWGTRDRSNWRGGTDDPKLKHHGFKDCNHAMGNRRSVWRVNPTPFKGAHFATFPPDLIKPCILAGCPEGGTVLDPFGGSGTTGEVAAGNGRDAILIEVNPAYVELCRQRTAQGVLPLYTENPTNLARESASVDQHSVVGRSK